MIAVLLPKMTMIPGLTGPVVALLMLVSLAALACAFQDLRHIHLSKIEKAGIVAVILAVMFSAQAWAAQVLNPCDVPDLPAWLWYYYGCWMGH